MTVPLYARRFPFISANFAKKCFHRKAVTITAVHMKEKPHECEFCWSAFGECLSVKIFLGKIHTHEAFLWGGLPRCAFLVTAFLWKHFLAKFALMKGNLREHITANHLREKPHEWILPGKIFTERQSPNAHHGNLPHECEICQNRSSQKGYLNSNPPQREASWVWTLPKHIFTERLFQ